MSTPLRRPSSLPSARPLQAPHHPTQDPAPRHLTLVPPLDEHETSAPDSADIPDPSADLLRLLAVQGCEVLLGTRSLGRLTPLITMGLARSLNTQRARLHSHLRFRGVPLSTPRPGSVRIDRPAPGIVEAAVPLHFRTVSCAAAIRLEWTHRCWRATELVVL